MSAPFYGWLKSAFSQQTMRHDGVVAPFSSGADRLEFRDALVKQVVLPELDRSVGHAAVMTVGIVHEGVQFTRSRPPARPHPKPWFVRDFRLWIDGLESDCKHVEAVSAVSANVSIKQLRIGPQRFPEALPTGVGYSRLVIALPNKATHGFQQWFELFIKGAASSKKGSLEYLRPGGGHPYLAVGFHGLRIMGMTHKGALTHVTMANESMSFDAKPAALSH